MPIKRFELKEGHEIRGFMVRLYPDPATEEKLKSLESDTRRAWNWLCKQVDETLEARKAYALKQGLVPPRPVCPNYTGLTPDQAKAKKEAYIKSCIEWNKQVHDATDKNPICAYRKFNELLSHFGCKYDYQLLQRVIAWRYEDEDTKPIIEPGAHLLQALAKNYLTKIPGNARKKFRRSVDSMPLQVRSGECFELGNFGSRGHTHKREESGSTNYYNCQVLFNGLKIKGRLPGKVPEGRVLEGVSIKKKADGWWASIKQEVPVRQLPAAIPNSVVGIDVGLDNIAAISETRIVSKPEEPTFSKQGVVIAGREKPVVIKNNRNRQYATLIAKRQAAKKDVGRLHLAASRQMKHTIYNEIIKRLADVETIKVEELSSRIGQMGGSTKMSVMRQITTLLKQRYKERVREVPPHHTSQDCSQCGTRSKESWSYENGRVGKCPGCGYENDRDINAARNIAAKHAISLAA